MAGRFSRRVCGYAYRFHRFTDSRLDGHNGRAPFELAGVIIDNIDWVRFSQEQQH